MASRNNGHALEQKVDEVTVFEYNDGGQIEIGHIVSAYNPRLRHYAGDARWQVIGFTKTRVKLKRLDQKTTTAVNAYKLSRRPDRNFDLKIKVTTSMWSSITMSDDTIFKVDQVVYFERDASPRVFRYDGVDVKILQSALTAKWYIMLIPPNFWINRDQQFKYLVDGGFDRYEDAIVTMKLMADDHPDE